MRKKHFTRQVGLIIAEETYNRLVEQTDREEMTVSEWVREAIERRLELKKTIPKAPMPDK